MKMNNCAVVTVIAKNYLSFARVLTESIKNFHPETEVFVVLADRVDACFDPKKETFTLITIDELAIPDADRHCFAYNSRELIGSLKPFAMEYIFYKRPFDKIIYLDSDIYLTGSLAPVAEILDNHDIVITPHLSKTNIPFKDELQICWEYVCIDGDMFNAGFIGVSNTPGGLDFVKWLKNRVTPFKRKQRFTIEQTWLNYVPVVFENVHILRNPAYNLAFWNLHERDVQIKNGNLWVDDEPLCFYHFGGINLDNIDSITTHRYNDKRLNSYLAGALDNFSVLKPLFKEYRELNIRHGYRETIKWPRAFDRFDSGERISIYTRYFFMRLEILWDLSGDPFSSMVLRVFNIFVSLGGMVFKILPYSVKKGIRQLLL